ncbi:hypothetical protein FPV67DRAFT_1405975 [Lyophyllum atratum]|nr:hypothetical protein FPV67DRAFT_1405975 [Lyophyllum atratum]
MSVVPPGDVSQSSGTAAAPNYDNIQGYQSLNNLPEHVSSRDPESSVAREEQALESHEVIELQTFSERKVWIEEKIKSLEKMPPIEVFAGLDAVRASAEHVPGLITPHELKQWITEHDTIEKETEQFDRGELTKLRQLTKAATQRNLSPADTDVIELTLTTIYELDKLLHLLRDRSENLELLGVRLSWEESRIAGWVDRRKILQDLQTFLDTRARWTPSVYENPPRADEPHDPRRRSSVTSLASVASDSSVTPSKFSRSARFKLAELLSRDAAQFAGRVTSLRHGKIAAAGKVLDKLIDHSRKPVPEELLDEQDKLEEKGITDMEHVGKFAMNIVMQWRKADEIYVETMKDRLSAQNLFEEIETAKLHHPTSRQSASFVSRADALVKRLALRGNPASSSSTFPRPEHPLFGDQKDFNKMLAQSLSSEIASTTTIAHNVDGAAKAYRTAFEAVKRVENMITTAQELSTIFASIVTRIQEGVSAGDGDGSPPNLMTEACLEPSRHSAFLALLPSILNENVLAVQSSTQVLRNSLPAILGLDLPGISMEFKANAGAEFRRLGALQNQAREACDDVTARGSRLREARRIQGVIDRDLKHLGDVRQEITDMMETQRWRQVSGPDSELPTPESSPATPLPTKLSHSEFVAEIVHLSSQIAQGIDLPLVSLDGVLEEPLKQWLLKEASLLKGLLDGTKKMAELLKSIQKQADAMESIHNEFNDLQLRFEDAIERVESCIDEVLSNRLVNGDIPEANVDLQSSLELARDDVTKFVGGLVARIPFVNQHVNSASVSLTFNKRRSTPMDPKFGRPTSLELPFDLAVLDDAVRSDSNSFAMKLNGRLECLVQRLAHFDLARMAKELDATLGTTTEDISKVNRELTTYKSVLSDLLSQHGDTTKSLNTLLMDAQRTAQNDRPRIACSFSPIRELLRKMDAVPGVHDASVREVLYVARRRAVDSAEDLFKIWESDISTFLDAILHEQKVEATRLEQLRIAEELRQQAERDRIAAEEAERSRVEQERLEMEKEEKLKEERKAEALRQQAEQDRIAAEQAEVARLTRERVEAEERRRLEEERLVEEALIQAENDRIAAEEAEKIRLHQERLAVEEKLRLVKEELAAERRLQAERDRIAAERLEQDRKVRVLVFVPVSARVVTYFPDIFGLRIAPSEGLPKTKEMTDLQAQCLAFRKRLRSISINETCRPKKSSAHLPNLDQLRRMARDFSSISSGVSLLPSSVPDFSVDVELRSLRAELEASAELMKRVEKLAQLADEIQKCDAALSDFLEHIDSYPAPPKGILSSSHRSLLAATPEEQLVARLSFTRGAIESMISKFASVSNDSRALAEKTRILQTWSELEEMGNDRLGGKKSRPPSTISSRPSSGRNSSASAINPRSTKKTSGYSNLSASSTSSQKRLLVPNHPTPRRAVSGGSAGPPSRPLSQVSNLSSNRAVSGPLGVSLHNSTFASRQRTSSLSNSVSTPVRHPSTTPMRSRAQTAQHQRASSPTGSEASSYSRSARTHTRSSTSMSSWSRAPRNSLSSIAPMLKGATPPKKSAIPRKTYVADPQNKLDVAVGDVVNNLSVGINIEGVSETWKDQSGKYWIGNQDPKLCFCRILRSQTVMVRVGGGWSELSKFIKDHFADTFRLLPESPPRPGAQEERWISSTTLLEAPAEVDSPPVPPRTPEPTMPFVPSFSLSTPSGQSPRSMKSASNSPSAKGSPGLTPLQFMRRADMETILRPVTPSRPSTILRPRSTVPQTQTPARNSVWRP